MDVDAQEGMLECPNVSHLSWCIIELRQGMTMIIPLVQQMVDTNPGAMLVTYAGVNC